MNDKLKKLKLGITSDCKHFTTPSGEIGTDTHIFLRQIEALAVYFESVIICCPFIEFPADLSYSVYQDKKITFIPAPDVGGNSIADKLVLIMTIPKWIHLFRKLDQKADIVYQRFPNNLNIPGFFYFYFKRKRVFATFTGSWDKDPVASFSTRFQKFMLEHFFRGPVWVYTNSNGSKKNIYRGFSPSYSETEWEEEGGYIESKIKQLKMKNQEMLKMISVGTLCSRKNHSFILNTCLMLKESGIPFQLIIAGAGERMDQYQRFVVENNLCNEVELKGSVHYNDLRLLYRQSDYVVQSPLSEAYGKVPVEGFFHGLIPVLSTASILADYFTLNGKRGFVFDLKNEYSLFEVLKHISLQMSVNEKIEMIKKGRSFVKGLTTEAWAYEYANTISAYYND